MRAAGVAVTIKAIAMRASVHELPAIRDFARGEGLDFRYDAVLSPRIDGGRKPLAQRLTSAEVAAIETLDDQRVEAFADYCSDNVGEQPSDDRKYQCGAGLNTIIVDPYGKMHVCQLSRRPGWDVLEGGLADGFYRAFTAVREEKRDDTTGCHTCPTNNVCSNCVGMSELEGRSTDVGDPYFCHMTDARAAGVLGAARPTPKGLVKLRLGGQHGRREERSGA